MYRYISAYENKSLDFKPLIRPQAELVLVKNRRSEAVAVCDRFSRKAGYENPIDYLGNLDYDLKMPGI